MVGLPAIQQGFWERTYKLKGTKKIFLKQEKIFRFLKGPRQVLRGNTEKNQN